MGRTSTGGPATILLSFIKITQRCLPWQRIRPTRMLAMRVSAFTFCLRALFLNDYTYWGTMFAATWDHTLDVQELDVKSAKFFLAERSPATLHAEEPGVFKFQLHRRCTRVVYVSLSGRFIPERRANFTCWLGPRAGLFWAAKRKIFFPAGNWVLAVQDLSTTDVTMLNH